MGRILKAVIYIAVLGFIGLSVYGYLGNFGPEQGEIRQPVEIHVGN